MRPLVLAALSALSVNPLASHALQFSPPDGAELKRTITWTLASKTDSSATTLGGEPTDEVPNLGYTSKREVALGVTDRMESITGGRPARFVRSYTNLLVEYGADLTLDVMGQEAKLAMTGDGTSALEGCDVRFTWSDSDEGWSAEWADDSKKGPDALLATVGADLDLLGLLPEGAVDVGDTWTVELSALVGVLFPGGGVGLMLETDLDQLDGALDPSDLPTVDEVLRAGTLEGEATCVLLEVDGEVAHVVLEVEVRAIADLATRLERAVDEATPEGIDADVTRGEFKLTLRGEGKLTFGLTTGHVGTFGFEGETREESVIGANVHSDGSTFEYEQHHTRSGTVLVRTTIE